MKIDLNKEVKDRFGLDLFPSQDRFENFNEALKSSQVLSKMFIMVLAYAESFKGKNPIIIKKEDFAKPLNKSKPYIYLYFDQLVDYHILKKETTSSKKVNYSPCFTQFYDELAREKLLTTAKKCLDRYAI